MAELKTKRTEASVDDFLNTLDDARRDACRALVRVMSQASGEKPRMWGASIVGFGEYHYKYATGREGDWFLVGFSPRKKDLTLYVSSGVDYHQDITARLGKFTTGKSCIYVKRLSDIDLDVLDELVRASVDRLKKRTAG